MFSIKFSTLAILAVAFSGLVASAPLEEREMTCHQARDAYPTGTCPATTGLSRRKGPPPPGPCVKGEQCNSCTVTSTVCKSDVTHDYTPDNRACIAGLGSLVDPFRASRGADWQYLAEPTPSVTPPNNATLSGTINVQGIDADKVGFFAYRQCDNYAYATLYCKSCCDWVGNAATPSCDTCPPGQNAAVSSTANELEAPGITTLNGKPIVPDTISQNVDHSAQGTKTENTADTTKTENTADDKTKQNSDNGNGQTQQNGIGSGNEQNTNADDPNGPGRRHFSA